MNKVLIKTYKGIDIFFILENSTLSAKDKKTGEEFKGKYVFEIEQQIDEPYWEPVDKVAFVKSGYFGKELQKVVATKQDRKSKKCVWEVKEDTGTGYDVGKKLDNWRETKVYPFTEERQNVFNKVNDLEKQIKEIERKQQELIKTL